MTTEEKAEAYDKVFARVKRMFSEKELNYLFPELKESEDGRIREGLIQYFKHFTLSTFAELDPKKILAWLEKQGKEEYVLKSYKDEDVRKFVQCIEKQAKAYEFNLPNRGYDIYAFAKDLLVWLEKQGEQNPAWSEEDENMCLDLIQYFTDGYGLEHNLAYIVDWLKSLKDRVGCEVNCTTTKEWSEEDEAHFDSILKRCTPGITYTSTRYSISEDINWFKSLKERYTWKPSEEQMKILSIYENVNDVLASLYQDLKKLK